MNCAELKMYAGAKRSQKVVLMALESSADVAVTECEQMTH